MLVPLKLRGFQCTSKGIVEGGKDFGKYEVYPKDSGDIGVKFMILTNGLGEGAVHSHKGADAANLRSDSTPMILIWGKGRPPHLPAPRHNVPPS